MALDPAVLDLARAPTPAVADDPLESPADQIVRATYTLTFDWLTAHSLTVNR